MYTLGKGFACIAHKGQRAATQSLWTRQGISLAMFLLAVIGLLSIWSTIPQRRLADRPGAGRRGPRVRAAEVVTSFPGYF